MGILNLIIAKATEINLACSTQDSVAPLQCHDQSATLTDLWITVAICVTVVVSICVLAICTYIIIVKLNTEGQKKNQSSNNNSTQDSKKNDPITEKDRFDAAWKFVDMCWKVEHTAPSKAGEWTIRKDCKSTDESELTKADKERYEEAWSVVRKYIGAIETKNEKDK